MAKTDEVRFEQVFRTVYPAVAAFVFRLVDDYDVAEDIALDALTAVWYRVEQLNDTEDMRRFAFRAARNAALNYRRQERDRSRILGPVIDGRDNPPGASQRVVAPDQLGEDADVDATVRRAIAAMPEQRRAAYALKWEQGMTNRDVAATLGLSVKTVEMHVSLALKELRQALAWLRDPPTG